jgi:hypothetical protein
MLNEAGLPALTKTGTGCEVSTGASITVRVAEVLVAGPSEFDTTQR